MKNQLTEMRKLITLLLMLFSAAVSHSLDLEQSLAVGITEFSYTGSSGNAYLSSALPARIYEKISITESRFAGPAELGRMAREEKSEEIKLAQKELETLYSERDQFLFSGSAQLDFKNSLIEKDEKISEKLEQINSLNLEYTSFETAPLYNRTAGLNLEFKRPDEHSFYKLSIDEEATADKYDLDFILSGNIEAVDELVYLDMIIWYRFTEAPVYSFKTAVPAADIFNIIDRQANRIISALRDREWSLLTLRSNSNAMIYIDDNFSGISFISDIMLLPGAHKIKVRMPGFKSEERVINTSPDERLEYNLFLNEQLEKEFIIQTFPQHADIYKNSVWEGESPVKITVNEFPATIMIKKEGYKDQIFFVHENDQSLMNINLNSSAADDELHIQKKKSAFYGSFGAALLSIPLTMMSYSAVEQSTLAYNTELALENSDQSVLNDIIALEYAQYAVYLGCTGLNVFLIFDTIIKAVDYINSVEMSIK